MLGTLTTAAPPSPSQQDAKVRFAASREPGLARPLFTTHSQDCTPLSNGLQLGETQARPRSASDRIRGGAVSAQADHHLAHR
jgi:hypothetical protein